MLMWTNQLTHVLIANKSVLNLSNSFMKWYSVLRFERTEPVLLDVDKSPEALDDLINSHQVVVSLLPWPLHPKIAERFVDYISHTLMYIYIIPVKS